MTANDVRQFDQAVLNFGGEVHRLSLVIENFAHITDGLTQALDRHTEAMNRVAYLETQSSYTAKDLSNALMNTEHWKSATPEQILKDMNDLISRMFRPGDMLRK